MSYNSGSNRARIFKSENFEDYSRDYSLNCTPLGPITITNIKCFIECIWQNVIDQIQP